TKTRIFPLLGWVCLSCSTEDTLCTRASRAVLGQKKYAGRLRSGSRQSERATVGIFSLSLSSIAFFQKMQTFTCGPKRQRNKKGLLKQQPKIATKRCTGGSKE